MRRYLVVANQTLGGKHLAEKVLRCLAEGPSRFHIVVPATLTERERKLYEELREASKFDPRSRLRGMGGMSLMMLVRSH